MKVNHRNRWVSKLLVLTLVLSAVIAMWVPTASAEDNVVMKFLTCEQFEHVHGEECPQLEDGSPCLWSEHVHTDACYSYIYEDGSSSIDRYVNEVAEAALATPVTQEEERGPMLYATRASGMSTALNSSAIDKVQYGEDQGDEFILRASYSSEVSWWFDGGYSSSDFEWTYQRITPFTNEYGDFKLTTNYAKVPAGGQGMSGHVGQWITDVGIYDGVSIDCKITYYFKELTVYGYDQPTFIGLQICSDAYWMHPMVGGSYEVKYEFYRSDDHSESVTIRSMRTMLYDIDGYQYYGLKMGNGTLDGIECLNDSSIGDLNGDGINDGVCTVSYAQANGYHWFKGAKGLSDNGYESSIVFKLSNTSSFYIVYGTPDDISGYGGQYPYWDGTDISGVIYTNEYYIWYYKHYAIWQKVDAAAAANDFSTGGTSSAMLYGYGYGPSTPEAPTKSIATWNSGVTARVEQIGSYIGWNEEFEYIIYQWVPFENVTSYYYDSFVISDTLPSCVTYKSCKITNNAGKDITSKFTVNCSGSSFRATASADLLKDYFFYGNTIKITITVTPDMNEIVTSTYKDSSSTSSVSYYKFTNKATSTFTRSSLSKTYTNTSNTVTATARMKPLTLKKVWNDGTNTEPYRPSSVKFYVKDELGNVWGNYDLSASNNWTETVEVPLEDEYGRAITWYVSEPSLSDYTASTSGGTITNTPNTGTITVQKAVVGKKLNDLSGFEFKLTGTSSGGKAISITAKTNSNGVATFQNVFAGNYTVTEINIPSDYSVSPQSASVTLGKGQTKSAGTFTNTVKTGTVTVTKTSTDNVVKGMTFQLTGTSAAGESVSMTATTNDSGVATFSEVPISNDAGYTIVEVNTPLRYYVPSSVTGVTVASGGTTNKTVKNETTVTDVLKVDQDGKPLAGAKLEIRDSSGNIVTSWTSTTATKTIRGLSRGETYYVYETQQPSGYFLQTSPVSFTVAQTGTNTVTFSNKQTITKITKVNESGTALAGATLQVLTKSGTVVDEWTSTTSAHVIKGLVAGELYTLKEVSPASGYATAASINFTVKTDGTDTIVKMTDKQTTYGFLKKSQDGDNLAGAKLALYDSNNTLVTEWTSTTDYHYVKGLVAGKSYTLKELSSPYNYSVASSISFTIKDTAETQYVTMTDMLDVVSFSFTKVNSQQQPLKGATFALYACSDISHTHSSFSHEDTGCWTLLQTASSNSSGVVTFSNLTATRKYVLVETKAPEGYSLPSGYWTIRYDETVQGVEGTAAWQVEKSGTSLELKYSTVGSSRVWNLNNNPKFNLPEAGGTGMMPYLYAGFAVVVIALVAGCTVMMRKRKRN